MSSSNFSNNSYTEFLKNHKTKDCKLMTHTRIGDVENHNVYPGKYHIPPEDLPEFYKLYEDHVFFKKNKEYLTEKQLEKYPVLAVDFDFRYNNSVQKRQHYIHHVQNLVLLPYVDSLMELCDFPENCNEIKIFIMEKPNVNILSDYTKDGIHLIIGCRVDREVQKEIRQMVLDRNTASTTRLPLINSWEDVIDKAITNGSNNWQLLGSRKPGHEAYEVTSILGYTKKEKQFIRYELDEISWSDISVQNETFPIFKSKSKNPVRSTTSKGKRTIQEITPTIYENEQLNEDGLTKNEELLYMIRIDPKNRQHWLWICSCIKFNGMTNENWERFGELNDLNWDTEKEKLFDSCRTDSKKNDIYHLQNFAEKNSDPEEYKQWLQKWNVYRISALEVVDPFSASKVIYKTLQHSLRLCKESWYMLQKNQLWKSQKEAGFFIVEEMHKYLDQGRNHLNHMMNNTEGDEKENYIKELKKWIGFYQLVSSNSYVSGITKYLRTLLADDKFAESLNSLKGKLAFQNGIMDLETKTFREGIRYDDYITETIPFDYRPVENTDFVRSKLKLILNNNDEHLEYHLSVFGFSFVGMPDLMKSVFFHIDKTTGGRGDNGKSFFFSILNELMPNYVYKSKSTFLDKNNSKNHKQISHIKGKRLVFLEEMPKTQAMNHSLFKEIGDGTSIENEVMYGTCEKIKIQCVLHALSNHIPDLNAEEEACYNRYRQISYNSHFDRTKMRVEENYDKLEFIADESLKETIINEYADEVFNLIIDYAHLFFLRGKKLPPIPKQFQKDTKDTQEANDRFGNWFVDNLEEAEGERVPIEKIEEESKLDRKQITTGMQRRGYTYNKDMRGMGKDVCGKHYKGGFEGVRFIQKYDDEPLPSYLGSKA